jgi:hypothetical protein
MIKNGKPDDGDGSEGRSDSPIFLQSWREEYDKYFKEISSNEELYDLDQIRSQSKGGIVDYTDVENTKWEDSPTTPKPSTSKLPETQGIMIPISRK